MEVGKSMVWAGKKISSNICIRIDSDLNDLKPMQEIFLVKWVLWGHLVRLSKAATSFFKTETIPNFRTSPLDSSKVCFFYPLDSNVPGNLSLTLATPCIPSDLIGTYNFLWLFWNYSQLLPHLAYSTLEAGDLNSISLSYPFQQILKFYKCC